MSRFTTAILLVVACAGACAGCGYSDDPEHAQAGTFLRPGARGGPGQVRPSTAGLYMPSEVTYTGHNHAGCVEFRDPEDIVAKGPITKVEVVATGLVYGIRLYYGQDAKGLLRMGPGENEVPERAVWVVPEGERIVRVEGEIVGNYISRLKFVTDKGKESPVFGTSTGKKFVASEPGFGGLRTISGQVNQTRSKAKGIYRAVTSMTFHFGAPCYIKDINYDLTALQAASVKAVPERVAQQEIPNRTSVEQSVNYSDSKKIETTKTLTFKECLGLKLERKIEAGIPGFGSASASFEMSASVEAGQSFENKSSQDVTWSVPVRVPPGKKIVALSTVKRYQAVVPFTYTVAWYWGTKDNILKEVTLPGVYEGIHVEDLRHEFKEVPVD